MNAWIGFTSHLVAIMLAVLASGGCRAISRIGESNQSLTARKLSRQGLQAMHHGQWNAAEQLFSDALAVSDIDDRAHRGISEAYWKRGQKDAAIKHMERAVELSAKDPKLVGRLGQMYLDVGRAMDAEHQSLIAVESERDSAEIWALRGDCLRTRGTHQEALAAYHRALALQPDYAEVKLRVAEIYLGENRYDRLLATLDQFNPDGDETETPARVHMLRGIAMKNLGRDERAIKHFVNASQRDPSIAEPHLQIAAINLKNQQPREANSRIQTAFDLNPSMVRATGWAAYLDSDMPDVNVKPAAMISDLRKSPRIE